jgi:hypothetical protein
MAACFALRGGDSVGIWVTRRETPTHRDVEVEVDMLVPEAVSPGIWAKGSPTPRP